MPLTIDPRGPSNSCAQGQAPGNDYLDGQERILKPDYLVIADGEKAVAVAGIMGGENSEVVEDTTTVLIESANFDPTNIRRTSRGLGLRSESSLRFEKELILRGP